MNLREQVLKHIDETEVVGLLCDLIKIPSVFIPDQPGCNEEKVALYVADYLRGMGLEVHVEEVAPGRPNVIGILRGKRPGKCILLEAHTDVVTPGNRALWSHDPFGAEIVGRRIYGRGACDTKNGITSAIMAVKAIMASGIEFPGKIILAIPVDEEGMMIGVKDMIRKGWTKGVDGALVCEPEDNRICVAQKGAMRVLVTVRGKQAHGCMPYAGVNPNTRAAKFISAVAQFEQREVARLGRHEYLGYPSLTPTVVRAPAVGEGQLNVIPAECSIALDIRTVPGQDHRQIFEELKKIAATIEQEDTQGIRIELDWIEDRPVTEVAKDEPIVVAVAEAYRELTGKEPVYDGVPGATDGTFLQAWGGVPVVVTGSGVREVPHQPDEWVDIDQLMETTRLYALSILKFLGLS
ncbi:MAG TPA: M20 family metallopeptidase [Firmicutes bacterium]|uniref:Probable succinyl-diaminopimelate desuccinylase n=1 Tax=Candidatus Fermentithermobacillus carboniphilus TaxID=3085328 RepID=A0AAT9LDE6_9FIRM|nr:MAG: M20 family metallopeptidase [Candidatus Fermentithermobacillus carboniphilus]HHW18068.1 M20 family metallopeptidase [Candidatus Fermentithermobacillaceae bacterium]